MPSGNPSNIPGLMKFTDTLELLDGSVDGKYFCGLWRVCADLRYQFETQLSNNPPLGPAVLDWEWSKDSRNKELRSS